MWPRKRFLNLVPVEFQIFIPNAMPNVSTIDSKRVSVISSSGIDSERNRTLTFPRSENDSQLDTLDVCSTTVPVQINYKMLFANINPASTCNLWYSPSNYHNPLLRLVSLPCNCLEHMFGINPVSHNRPW